MTTRARTLKQHPPAVPNCRSERRMKKKEKQMTKSLQGSMMRPARSTTARMTGFRISSQNPIRRKKAVMYHSLIPSKNGEQGKTKRAWSALMDSRTGIPTCWAMRYY